MSEKTEAFLLGMMTGFFASVVVMAIVGTYVK